MTLPSTYQWIICVVAIGLIQSSLENLLLAIRIPAINQFRFGNTKLTPKYINWMKFTFDSPGIWVVSILRLGLSIFLIVSAFYSSIPWYLPISLVILDIAGIHRYYFFPISEVPLQRAVLVAATFHLLFNNPQISLFGLIFITAQLILAYFAAGWHKFKRPSWRNGVSMMKFFRKYLGQNYKNSLNKNMPLLKWMGWLVITFEMLFPLSLIGGSTTLIFFGVGIVFHTTLSLGSGINFFLWTFVGCYPALLYLSNEIHGYLF
jgi:hypothetical protein